MLDEEEEEEEGVGWASLAKDRGGVWSLFNTSTLMGPESLLKWM